MTDEDARAVLKEALLHVDFINLGATLTVLGQDGQSWKSFDNSKWRPNRLQALRDSKWLQENAEKLALALKTLYVNR